MTNSRRLRAALLGGFLIGALGAPPAHASAASEVGWGVGSAVSTLVYAPLKVAYATVGLTFGGLGWALSGGDPAVAEVVIVPAIRGDYVVTPAHLRGERRLSFVALGEPAAPEDAMLGPGDSDDAGFGAFDDYPR